jgi:hypothetical protein
MPFSPLPEKQKYESNFKKVEFIKLTKGTNVIRILDEDYVTYVTHYVPSAGVSFKCLGRAECPVCQHNKQLIVENPETFRNIQGYLPQQIRHYINVLDRTPVKVCTKCQKETKAYDEKYPSACECGAFITAVVPTPLNKVKILSKGNELFEKFLLFQRKYGDITTFDIELNAHDKNDKKSPDALPIREQNDVVTIDPELKFNLSEAILVLGASEINDVLRGVSLKDIFKARKVDKLEDEVADITIDVKDAVNSLFNQ